MTRRNRLAVIWAALTADWHRHECSGCHTQWFCYTGICASEQEPVTDICASCEEQASAQWARIYQLKHPTIRRVQ